ncbi:MAG TPA: hypothetical protein ENN65_04190 [Candidatus Hydrogenedentes bacterium]|nr:hypothetical protein [Candidatus Hydrogenedentota bacterium]
MRLTRGLGESGVYEHPFKTAAWVTGGLILLAVLWPRTGGSPVERAARAEGRVVITYPEYLTTPETIGRVL